MKTVWIFGDQLNRELTHLDGANPVDTQILMIRSRRKVDTRPWHKQRLHLVLASMERFAEELRTEGFTVDFRTADTMSSGLADHRAEFSPTSVRAMEPLSWDGQKLLESNSVEIVKSNQMLCHVDDFATWGGNKETFRMEDFYRWQRKRLDILMDGDQPAGGQWNWDHDNRNPPPKDGKGPWHAVTYKDVDDLDRRVMQSLPEIAVGADPDGWWCTTRSQALGQLDDFIEHVLPNFGPYEDAMLHDEPRLAHSMLSHAMNIGLLHPLEIVEAAEASYRAGKTPINSAEGFIRQIIGWREYVWNVYWRWMPDYRHKNVLANKRDLPPVYVGSSDTKMHCMSSIMKEVDDHAWVHHIPRLMVLANFAMISGVDPWQVTKWMWERFVDGAEWVMLPNVIGMAMYADGGRMSTKPYAAGGAYINRMSNYCKGCHYDPKKRTGDDACPFTTLYWDFLARHRERFGQNHRMNQQMVGLRRLNNLDEVRDRAKQVLAMLDAGTL